MHLETAIRTFFAERPDLRDQHIVLAVSGGPDSVALAWATAQLAAPYGLGLFIAHLDHALRADSARDALTVAELGRRLDLAVVAQRADVRGYARAHRQSIEAAARVVRYGFLADVTRQVDAAAVATGHTADDQAETILLRLVRGTGPLGLAGMRPDRTLRVAADAPPLRLLRPFLQTTRAETVACCAAHDLPYVVDPSNADLRFARNRVRHEVLPLLEGMNPAVRAALCRTGEMAAALADLVASEAERAWQRCAQVEARGVGFPADRLRALPRPVQVALLERAAAVLQGDLWPDLTASHLAAALALLAADGKLREVHWPGGRRVQRVGAELWVGARPARPGLSPAGYALAVPGEVALPAGARLIATLRDVPCAAATADRHHVDVARAVVGDRLTVRGPQPGDQLRPRGLGGSKKVQDVLTDAKVPRPDRAGVPVVVGHSGPFWVVGLALDEGVVALGPARQGESSASVVCLRYSGDGERSSESAMHGDSSRHRRSSPAQSPSL